MILSDLNGGISPVCDYVGDPEVLDKEDFILMFDWILFNNGLIMEYPIMLN
jgi:hypothetical protein